MTGFLEIEYLEKDMVIFVKNFQDYLMTIRSIYRQYFSSKLFTLSSTEIYGF